MSKQAGDPSYSSMAPYPQPFAPKLIGEEAKQVVEQPVAAKVALNAPLELEAVPDVVVVAVAVFVAVPEASVPVVAAVAVLVAVAPAVALAVREAVAEGELATIETMRT